MRFAIQNIPEIRNYLGNPELIQLPVRLYLNI